MQQYILVYFLVSFMSGMIARVEARKCYVCGPKAYDPFKKLAIFPESYGSNKNKNNVGSEKLAAANRQQANEEKLKELYTRSCETLELHINDRNTKLMQEYVKECPSNYLGCLTQTDAYKNSTRTCEHVAFNDCQAANGVTYCYCKEDLCNENPNVGRNMTKPEKPKINLKNSEQHNRYSNEESDDEDISVEESSGMDPNKINSDNNDEPKQSNKSSSREFLMKFYFYYFFISIGLINFI